MHGVRVADPGAHDDPRPKPGPAAFGHHARHTAEVDAVSVHCLPTDQCGDVVRGARADPEVGDGDLLAVLGLDDVRRLELGQG